MSKLFFVFFIPILGWGQSWSNLGLTVDVATGYGTYHKIGISVFEKVKKKPSKFVQKHIGLRFSRLHEDNGTNTYNYSIQLKRVWNKQFEKINYFLGLDVDVPIVQFIRSSEEKNVNLLTITQRSIPLIDFLYIYPRLGVSDLIKIRKTNIIWELHVGPLNFEFGFSLGYMLK